MTARLVITDGTTTVDLLNRISGYVLNRWRPTIAGYKRGGVHQQSPISDGRRLVSKYFDNAIETLDLKALDASQDELIEETQRLRRLLEKASDYWTTDWQDDPVWIEARATKETNTRYAVIQQGRIAEDENPFSQPFLQVDCNAVMDNLTLIVERMHWQAFQPRLPAQFHGGTCADAWAGETYEGVFYGVATDEEVSADGICTDIVYVVNKQNLANITHIYHYDASLTNWSVNLVGTVPYGLLPAAIEIGDFVYFCIDTSLDDSGPFDSLVFDIGTAGAGYTGEWQYQNVGLPGGPGFIALTVLDNTNVFFNPDVNSVHWIPPHAAGPNLWEINAVNGVTGWWVRMEILTVPGALTVPVQQTREVYAITWPRVTIDSDEILGDIPALGLMHVRNQSDVDLSAAPVLYANRVIAGLRSIDRGTDFAAYLNAAQEQNPAYFTVAIASPGASTTTFEERPDVPTGEYVQVLNVDDDAYASYVQWRINEFHSSKYYGAFRVFLRGQQVNGASGDVLVRLRVSMGILATNYPATERKPFLTTTDWEVLDLGTILIPPTDMLSVSDAAIIDLHIEMLGDDAVDVNIYDIILMPVDEWAGDFVDVAKESTVAVGSRDDEEYYLDIDSISYPKEMITSLIKTGNASVYAYQPIVNNSMILQANKAQNMWFFLIRQTANADFAEPDIASTIAVNHNDRYLSARGSR